MSNLTEKSRVAFYGHRGSFSEEAALKLCGAGTELVSRSTFESLFSSIDEGLADYILTPFENSLVGSVARPLDLLLESSLVIKAEIITRISLHLIGCPGASLEEIKRIESHPTALAECENFFSKHPQIKRLAAGDTAGCVARIIQSGDKTHAAIASKRAAEIYGGVVLRERVEDYTENYTRFFLLAQEADLPEKADKISLMLRLPQCDDVIRRAMESFTARGINLLKIEPRPIKTQRRQRRFYLELQAQARDSEVVEALSELTRVFHMRWRATGFSRKK